MECPWERVIRVISNRALYSPLIIVGYLTALERDIQPSVNDAPHLKIPFLPDEPPAHNAPNSGFPARTAPGQNLNGNRFQTYEEEDDDNEDEVEVDEQNGPRRRRNRNHRQNQGSSRYSAEDIYIQVITTLGEMLGLVALEQGRNMLWTEGASSFSQSYKLLQTALTLSDAMYASITARQDVGDIELAEVVERVRNKCHGISIAAAHSLQQKENFLHDAVRRRDKLNAKLQPQWEDRDAAMAKMGEERWKHNPRPKKNYAALREQDETELRALEGAMDTLAAVDYETVRTQADQRMHTL